MNDAGYAWRARIGLVKPTYGGKALAFWYRNAPDGVEVVPSFIGLHRSEGEDFSAGLGRAAELAIELGRLKCQLITVSYAPAFLALGTSGEGEWAAALQTRLGIHVNTGLIADMTALSTLGARRVAVVSYYGPALNAAIATRLASHHIEGLLAPTIEGTSQKDDRYIAPLAAVDQLTSRDVYRLSRAALQRLAGAVDCLYLAGAGWDAAPAIAELERDMRTAVVWSLAAEMWFAYSTLRIDNRVEGFGRLLREAPKPLEVGAANA